MPANRSAGNCGANKIDPKLSEEFEKDVLKLGSVLKSEDMTYWKLFQDPADNNHYLEIRIADTCVVATICVSMNALLKMLSL